MQYRMPYYASLIAIAIASASACVVPFDPPNNPSCEGPSIPTGLAACLVSPQAGFPENFSDQTALVKGVVSEVGIGAAPEGCFDQARLGSRHNDDETVWVRFNDEDGREWVAAFSSEFARVTAFPTAGEAISVDYVFWCNFGFDAGHLTVRNEGGTLLGWVKDSESFFDGNTPEEVGLRVGDSLCTQEEYCGTWQRYDLELSYAGTTTTLSNSESREFDTLNFIFGGHTATTFYSDQCADWGFDYLLVGAFAP